MPILTIEEEHFFQLVKQAVAEVLEERKEWLYPFMRTAGVGKPRAELVALARRAEGNWKAGEPAGSAVQIVRQLREEWAYE
ncbi:MAG: hypothetical protein EYC68_10305 [Chloroflexota bacterium]|nr:MAG: hypothetical protein EYC68_10305 [Chloroflexota bacterium]